MGLSGPAAVLLALWMSSQPGSASPSEAVGGESFRDCRGRAFTPAPDADWRHRRSSAVVRMGDAHHTAQDVIGVPAGPPLLAGKFSYGPTSKDLEDEKVRVSLDDCSGWRDVGEGLTNSDGRVSIAAPSGLGPGVYEVRFQVLGDG